MGSYEGQPIVTIYDMLDVVRMRPGMWIGGPNIEHLFVWIGGFSIGMHIAGDPLTPGDPDFRDFHDWVAARLGRQKNGHGWGSMLLEACDNDTERAFERFWIELDMFRASRAVH